MKRKRERERQRKEGGNRKKEIQRTKDRKEKMTKMRRRGNI